jgi:hypothetical protein
MEHEDTRKKTTSSIRDGFELLSWTFTYTYLVSTTRISEGGKKSSIGK